MAGKWIAKGPEMPDALLRLFCFAHAGGGATIFKPWRSALAPEIEVCPVVLPGRESRRRELPCVRITEFICSAAQAVQEYADRPFAFFGHSLGAIVAYEVARKLDTEHARNLVHLFVSARRAPHLPVTRAPLHLLPQAEFLSALHGFGGTPAEVLADTDLLRLFLPALRADFELNDTYVPLPGGLLSCPVTAISGRGDQETSRAQLAEWAAISTGRFGLADFAGDHFYLIAGQQALLARLRAELAQDLASGDLTGPLGARA